MSDTAARTRRRIKYAVYLASGERGTALKAGTKESACIMTVAFNKPLLIEWQWKLIAKNVIDKIDYLVIDNSTSKGAQESIGSFCASKGILYRRAPYFSEGALEPSLSHGWALNWGLRHLPCKYKKIAIIDHDIFPYIRTSISEKLKGSAYYGLYQYRGNRWYLWPGFTFLDLEKIDPRELDFRPGDGLDTGGGNWKKVFSKLYGQEQVPPPKHRYVHVDELELVEVSRWGEIRAPDFVKESKETLLKSNVLAEFVDDWIHVFNGSDWRGPAEKRTSLEHILKKIWRA